MLVSFSVIPLGQGDELHTYVAEIIKMIDASGLSYKIGAMQTTIEGDEDLVIPLVMACHKKMRTLSSRVLTSITIDDRRGACNRLEGKIQSVEFTLGKSLKK